MTGQEEFVALKDDYTNITVKEAKAMLDTELHLEVLDVRTPAEYSLGHLKNAKLIPVDELPERQEELSKSDTILVYCRLGVRSRRASQILASNNFLRVHDMLGGITAWIGAGLPVYSQQSSLRQAIARLRARFRLLLLRSVC
jgi:rhodanese-related sulfurtransferase